MKYLIFSDSHLTAKFNQKKYNFLQKIISGADQVIINGDFWDDYYCNIDEFLNSEWKKLFPSLKEKNTIYIYGNHDDKRYCKGHGAEFSIKQVESYKLKVGKYDLYLTHGDKTASLWDDFVFRKKSPLLFNFFLYAGAIAETILRKIFPKGQFVQSGNNKMKATRKELGASDNQILVCGHSHCPEFNLEDKYINTGKINRGYAEYLEIDGDKLNLILTKY